MYKRVGLLTLAFICLFTSIANSQNLKKQMLGDWVKIKIIDLKSGTLTAGKYSEPDSYVRFSFSKDLVYIVSAPFDKGLGIPYRIDNKTIKFTINPNLVLINEPEYIIKSLNSNELILYTTNIKKDTICYFFKRPTLLTKADSIIQFDPIIIKQIIFTNGLRSNHACIYSFNSQKYDYSTPTYDEGSLGHFLASAINLPKTFPLDKLSNELKVSLVISNKGKVISTDLIGSIDTKTDLDIKNFMNKTKWSINQLNTDIPIKLVFSLRFLLTQEKSPF
jgi:hypothetical protein